MVKAILLEVKSSMPSLAGDQLGRYGLIKMQTSTESGLVWVNIIACPSIRWIKRMSERPKVNVSTNDTTMGWPKTRERYGHRVMYSTRLAHNDIRYDTGNSMWRGRQTVTIILSSRFYSTSSSTHHVKSRLSSLETFCKSNPDQAITGKLYKFICDATFLEMAYNNIKSNP